MRLFILLFLYIPLSLHAASRPHLVCLGQEEVFIHKNKITGPIYKLNQQMISALLQLNESAQMDKRILDQVCKEQFTSLAILEQILVNKKSIFRSKAISDDIQTRSLDNFSLKELKKKSFDILISFLTNIQSSAKDINCLKKEIPEILAFYENAQYLLSELGVDRTLKALKNKKKVFKRLKKLPLNNKC